uniref:AAA ATPase AAA+ lid domain-containing protein n=1 Tax=Anopheles coluzzii TaxID=1518534 RepID=A0A6E8V669_ANOCL
MRRDETYRRITREKVVVRGNTTIRTLDSTVSFLPIWSTASGKVGSWEGVNVTHPKGGGVNECRHTYDSVYPRATLARPSDRKARGHCSLTSIPTSILRPIHRPVHPNPRHASLASNATSPPTATDSRWISSLRRRDPELQPTLPSINHSNHHSTSSLTQQHSIGYTSSSNTPNTDRRSSRTSGQKSSLRKSRSVERIRARKLATSKVKERPKKSSSEEGGASDDQEVTSVEENSPQQQHSPRVYIGLPNDNTRKALLELCLKGVNISPDLNTDTITEQLNGYTGSDIANVCRDAAMMAMRRHINGLSPSEIKMIRREEVDLPVTAQDFQDAMVKTRKSVSANDVARYETWMDEYGSC